MPYSGPVAYRAALRARANKDRLAMLKNAMQALRQFHASEQGAEGLEKLLIVAAIVLPLLGLLIWFRNELRDWVTGMWSDVRNDASNF